MEIRTSKRWILAAICQAAGKFPRYLTREFCHQESPFELPRRFILQSREENTPVFCGPNDVSSEPFPSQSE